MKLLKRIAAIFLLTLNLLGCKERMSIDEMMARATRDFENERFFDAVGALDSVLTSFPNHPAALYLRSKCHFELRESHRQIADLRRYIVLEEEVSCKERINATNDIINVFSYLEEIDSAIKYQRFLMHQEIECGLPPKRPSWNYLMLATLNSRNGQFGQAKIMADSAIILGDTSMMLEAIQVSIFQGLQDWDSAINHQNRILQRDGSASAHSGYNHFTRADLHYHKGDLKAACGDWVKARELGLEEAQAKLDSFCVE